MPDWRPCENPACDGKLSPLVPENIGLCTACQIEFAELRSIYSDGYLTENDLFFILCHPNGCNASQLANLLKVPIGTFVNYLYQETLQGVKPGCCRRSGWLIPYNEMVKAIEVFREWVSAVSLVDDGIVVSVDRTTFRDYVRAGRFGQWIRNFSGAICIHRSQIKNTDNKCSEIKSINRAKGRFPYKYIGADEFTPSVIAEKWGITLYSVHVWLTRHKIRVQKRGNRIIVLPKDLRHALSRILRNSRVSVKNTIHKYQLLGLSSPLLTRLTEN